MRSLVILGSALLFAIGCSDTAKEAVHVSGSVKKASGQPVAGVRLILEPTEGEKCGVTFGFDVDNEGRFSGEALPGSYVYYLSTITVERDDDDGRPVNKAEAAKLNASKQLLKKLPAAYASRKNAGSDRHVEVKSGKPLDIFLAK